MYDYLGGEQVKIFYTPNFYDNSIIHSGGGLRSFNEQSELPLLTPWYQYPQNFLVFDYDMGDFVWVIKEGKFKTIKSLTEINDKDFGKKVFNYCGQPLNINSIADFEAIKADHKKAMKAYFKGREFIFKGRKFSDILREDIEYYETIYRPRIEVLADATTNAFRDKWFVKDTDLLEKTFGAYLYALCSMKNDHDKQSDIEQCISKLVDIYFDNGDIINKFLSWYKDEPLLGKNRVNQEIDLLLETISNFYTER